MADVTEKFNVEEVKNKMDTLETAFNALSDALSEANKIVNEEVNVGPESALFGELGTVLLNTWNENASTFGDFHANFESWAQIVSVIAANNISFTEETISAYKDNGSTLTYKDDTTGERKSISGLREERAQEQTINYVKNNFPEDKYDITESDNALVIKDKNGNIVVEYSMENGKITSTKWYDSDGNYSVITYEVGEDGKLKKNVTYYDANGNVIEKPSSFYEDGTLRPDLSNNQEESGSSDTNGENDEDNENDEQENVTEVNLSDLKDGDKITIGRYEYVASEENGVITLTSKDAFKPIKILPDGTVKTLYGDEVEINGHKIITMPYTDYELLVYYGGLYGGTKKVGGGKIVISDLGKRIDIDTRNGRIDVTRTLGIGSYVRKVLMPNGNIYTLSVSGGVASFLAKSENGQEVKTTYKDVAEFFDENCTSLTYVGMNGHNKVMTRDSSTGYLAVKDSDGTLTCYDSNLNKVDITQTAFDVNGNVMSSSEIVQNAKKSGSSVYKIEAKEFSDTQGTFSKDLFDMALNAEKVREQFVSDSEKISKYVKEHANDLSSNSELYELLQEQCGKRKNISNVFELEFKVESVPWKKDGVYGDIDIYRDHNSSFNDGGFDNPSAQESAYTKAYNVTQAHNKEFEEISTIDDINEILSRLGYPIIQ